ncbi:hypothetical protein HJC23_010807 [Cyclotella cryptica]|uniref:Uncharacterized protein n=1 Tax=Cyclotella cryptica TaxID=29204 RepID=A0ABD3QQ32_9STRA
MAAVRNLLGRCGIGGFDDSLINDILDEPAPKPIVKKRASSLTSQLSCISPGKKYQPEDMTCEDVSSILEKSVSQLLECISSPLPPADGTSEERKAFKQMKSKKSEAFQNVYDMTKKGNEHNRIPLVSSTKWDIVRVLSYALLALDSTDVNDVCDENAAREKPVMNEDRRLICWTLNNLSIPYENKAIMAGGDASPILFKALTSVIQANLPSSYLCIICVMNLTFLAEAIEPVVYYVVSKSYERSTSDKQPVPPRSSPLRVRSRSVAGAAAKYPESTGNISERSLRLLENPASLLRVLERMMLINSPFLLSTVTSVQGESIRWACGLIRNVTFAVQHADGSCNPESSDALSGSTGRQGIIDNAIIEEICSLVSQTEIARLIVSFVRDSPRPSVKWTKDSLEDICLGILCQLAQWPSSREALKRAGATSSLEKIEG